MKKTAFSLVSVLALSSFVCAGGDIAPAEVEVVPVMVENSAFYIGLGYGAFTQNNDNINSSIVSIEFKYDSVLLQAGYQYNQYVALEGRYWIGVGDISQSGGFQDGDNPGDMTSWGLYVKPMYPVTDNIDLYALLGYADTSIKYDSGIFWDTSSFSWGLGAQYFITENVLIFADYVSLGMEDSVELIDELNKPSINADINLYTLNFGVGYKF